MATYVPTSSNDGYNNSGTWVAGGSSVTLTAGRMGILLTGLAYPKVYSTVTLQLYITGGTPGTLSVYLIHRGFGRPESPVPVFSDSRLPGGTLTAPATEELLTTAAVTTAGWATIDLTSTLLMGYLRHGDFAGSVPLTVGSPDALVVATSEGGNPARLVTGTELPLLTGLDGPEYARGQSRVDECPRTGLKGLRETWTRDGWSRALLRPEGYNPPDYVESYVHYERPPINDAG